MLQSRHLISSLRLIDADNRQIRTLSRVRPAMTAQDVGTLLDGFGAIMTTPAAGAQMTTQTELTREE